MKKSLQNSRIMRERRHFLPMLLTFLMLISVGGAWGQTGWHYQTFESTPSGSSWNVPIGTTKITVEAIGGGGAGGFAWQGSLVNPMDYYRYGGGGGGGAYARKENYSLSSMRNSQKTLTITVGSGGSGATNDQGTTSGGASEVKYGSTTLVKAVGGTRGGANSGNHGDHTGYGGKASDCVNGLYSGGNGTSGSDGANNAWSANDCKGGAGGGAAGGAGNGNGQNGGSGGSGNPTGGAWLAGGKGADGTAGSDNWSNGKTGSGYGAGGGGARSHTSGGDHKGGDGKKGVVRVWYYQYVMVVSISATKTTVCSGESVTLTADVTDAVGTPSYVWKKGSTTIGTGSSITINPTETATYTVEVTADNGVETATKQITVHESHTANAGGDGIICSREGQLWASGVTFDDASITKTWSCSNPNVTIDDPHSPNTIVTLANSVTLPAQITFTWTYSGNVCSNSSDQVVVTFRDCDPDRCFEDGTVVFSDDFGGNSQSDPVLKPTGLSADITSLLYHADTLRQPAGQDVIYGIYGILKKGMDNLGGWERPADHTYPGDYTRGYFMEIDGNGGGVIDTFYRYRVDGLCPNTLLYFSYWLCTVHPSVGTALELVLETPDGRLLARQFTGDFFSHEWVRQGKVFPVPDDVTSIVFYLINDAGVESGNDFCLDDIEIRLCTPPATISEASTLHRVCAGENLTLHGSYEDDGTFLTPAFRWFRSTDNVNWTKIDGATDLTYTINNIQSSAYYYMAVAGSQTTADDPTSVCRARTDELYVRVNNPEPKNDIYVHPLGNYNPINLDVLTNDVYELENTISVSIVSAPQHGSVTWDASAKKFVYTPESGYNGNDEFSYSLTVDGCISLTNATVQIYSNELELECPTNPSGSCYTFNAATFKGFANTLSIAFGENPDGATITLPTLPAGVNVSYTYSDQAHTKVSSAFVSKDGGLSEAEVQSIIRGTQFCLPNADMVKNITVMVDGSATPAQVFYYPENDHYYMYIKFEKPEDATLTWFDCYRKAKSMNYLGRQGYLSTVNNGGENQFLTRVCNTIAWLGGTRIAHGAQEGTMYYASFDEDPTHMHSADTATYGSTHWYWACGPERGQMIFPYARASFNGENDETSVNEKRAAYQALSQQYGYYSNWKIAPSAEPNLSTDDNEACLTLLSNDAPSQWPDDGFNWNDRSYNGNVLNNSNPNGYVIEFGNQTIGNSTPDDETNLITAVATVGGFDAGEISDAGQTICNGESINAVNSVREAKGGQGDITYKWQVNGTDIPGAAGESYQPNETTPGSYTYTRWAKADLCQSDFVQSTGSYTLNINAPFNAGAIQQAENTITRGAAAPTVASVQDAAGGNNSDNPIIYKWYVNGSLMNGQSDASLSIPVDPYTMVPGTYVFTRTASDAICHPDEEQSDNTYTLIVENNLDLELDCPTPSGNCYTFPDLTVTGYVRTITVGFTEDPADGMSVTLPALPTGWDADGNVYTQFISLPEGVSDADVQAFLRQVTFCVPDNSLKGIRILIDAEQTEGRIYYNSQNRHYYELVMFDKVKERLSGEIATDAEMKAQSADLNTTWMDAYNRAKGTTYLGRTGYLTTLTSYDEDLFVTRLTEGVAFIGGTRLSHTGDDGALHYQGFDETDQTNPDAGDYWYWACGPEKGRKLFNGIVTDIPSGMTKREYYEAQKDDAGNTIYSNWGGSEPNNSQSKESILTILLNHNYTGYQGHTDYFAWNDKDYKSNYVYETGDWGSQGFLIEFGDQEIGDSHEDNEDDYRTSSVVRYEEVGDGYDTVRATISGNAVYCGDETTTTQLSIEFSGKAPYSGKVTGSDGTEYTFTNIDASTYTFNVTPTTTTTYAVTEISDNAATVCHPEVKKEMLGTATVTVNPQAPQDLYFDNNSVCFGNDVVITANGGSLGSGQTVYWSESACPTEATTATGATYTMSAATAGQHTVYATLIGFCSTNLCQQVTVTVPEQLTIAQSGDITPAKCKGDENGEFKFTVSGGTAPYTVSVKKGTDDVTYTNDGNTYTVSDLAAGTYTVSVTDAHHCTATGTTSYVVTEPEAELEMSFSTHADSSRSESCDPANDGIATVNAKGGNGGYHYTWAVKNVDNTWTTLSQTGKMVTGLQGTREGYTGVYKVTVTDAKGCEVSDGTNVTLNNTLHMPETIQGPTICSGNSFVVQPADSSANGISQYSVPAGTTYSWGKPVHDVCVGGDGITPKSGMNAITGVLTSECPGLSYVTYTVEPQYGVCKGTSSDVTFGVEVNVNPGIVVTVPESYHKCSNDPNFNIQASFSNSLPPFTTKWTRRTNNDASTDEVVATHHHNVGDTCMLTVDLDDNVCKGVFAYKVEYVSDNAVGCKAEGLCVVTVDAGTWSIPSNGEKNVECVSAATEDNIDFPATAPQDACGRDLTRTFVGKELQPTEFSCNGKIVYTYRYTACDNSYKDWTYTFNIEDKTKPVVDVTGFSGQIAANIDQTKCEFTIPDLRDTVRKMSSDNCIATNNLTISQSVDAGTKITAATQVRVHVIDSCGNDSTIVITVTVPTLPTITNITSTAVTCHNGSNGTATVTPANGTAPYTYKWNDAANQTTNPAENLIAGSYKVTVTDANGCTVESTPVTVTQPDALSISGCLSNITKNTDEGKCYATVTWTNPTFAPTGNNAHLEVTGQASDNHYPKGVTTINIKAVNDCGEEVSCTPFTITVTDNQNPVITCAVTGEQQVEPNAGATETYTHSGTAWDATATDNCGVTSLTYTLAHPTETITVTDNTTLNGIVFPLGVTTVTWTAKDGESGHDVTCSFTVRVKDVTDPVITCKKTSDTTVVPNTTGNIYTFVGTENWGVEATDNVGVTSKTYTLSGATTMTEPKTSFEGQQFNYGTTLVTWKAMDAAGNHAECSFNVIVEDVTKPEITCTVTGNKAKDNDAGEGYHTHHESEEVWNASATDNSGTVASLYYKVMGVTTTVDAPNTTLDGQKFNIGTTTVRWYATDPVGNIDSCEFTVTVTGQPEDQHLVCPTATSSTWTYDGQEHSVAATVSPVGPGDAPVVLPTIYYSLDNSTWSTTAPSITDVEESPKHVYVKSTHPNYEDATCEYNLNITKASSDEQHLVCPTAASATWMYDGATHSVTATVNAIGDDEPTIYYSEDNSTWSTTAPSITSVTESPKHVYVKSMHPNYEDATCEYDLTVTPAEPDKVDMVCPTADDATWTYDGDEHSATATATSLIKPEDTFTIEYSLDSLNWSETVPTITNAGSQHVYVRALNPNYKDAACEYTLTVRSKQLTITGEFTKVYDGTPFTVSYDQLTYTGLVAGDAFTSGTITTDGYKVGVYHCRDNQFLRAMDDLFAYNSGFGPTSVTNNYTPAFDVTMRIVVRPVELTANSLGKVYDGTSLEAEGFSVTGSYTEDEYGFLGKDDVVSAEVQGEQLCVGESASSVVPESVQIMHEGEVVTDCYEFTFVDGTLTVTNVTTGLECAGAKTFTLAEGTSELVVTEAMIGEATYTGTAADVTITNNLDDLNPMTVRDEPYEVVWTLRDVCGNAMTTCTTLVTTQYTPCEGTYVMTDGSYPYKRIGSQCWFLLNLREKVGDYHPYKDINDNTDKFGYLYSWYTAAGVTEGDNTAVPMTYEGSNGESYVQGICPAGWSIGSDEDYEILNNYATHVMYLKSPSTLYWQSGFEGVNTPDNTGFDGRGGGWYNSSAGHYEDLMTGYHFWTSDATAFSSNATGEVINYYCDSITEETGQKADRRSVRCIRKVYND